MAIVTHLLAAGELELGPPECLNDGVLMLVVSPDGHEGLADVDTGTDALGLAESTSHSGLQPIGAGARQHFVDAEDVEGVNADLDVELILGRVLHHVLLAKNAKLPIKQSSCHHWTENSFKTSEKN